MLLRPLAGVLGQLGLDADDFLSALGVREETPPECYVSGDHVDRLLEVIAAQRGDPAFGLTLASAAAVRPLGLFGHMIWLSGTVRDAIERATRFYAVVSRRTLLTFDECAGEAVLRQGTAAGATRGRILTEYPFASFALRARAATRGRFAVQSVRFSHSRPVAPHEEAYRVVFDAPVTFGAPADEITFDASCLDLKMLGADPVTSTTLEQRVAQIVATTRRDPLIERVHRALASNIDAPVSLPGIASTVGISPRTLRRALEREGTSFRVLADAVRRQRADELIAAGRSMKDVALSLGFSEPSAFSRAYKRWTVNTRERSRS